MTPCTWMAITIYGAMVSGMPRLITTVLGL
jgi:hypothetical protein